MSGRKHGRSEIVSWTGSSTARRQVLGVDLRWSYAPAEVKVLTSLDGGNFQKAAGWCQIDRSEPGFEERIMFASMCFAADGSAAHALDHDEGACLGASQFFQGGFDSYNTAYFYSFSFILSFAATLQRQQESVRASLFYCSWMSLSKNSLCMEDSFVCREMHLPCIAVILRHSNVHPLVLLFVIVFLLLQSWIQL